MNFFDRLFVGKSVELGVIRERRFPFKPKNTALIAEKRGRLKFVIKESGRYSVYSPEEVLKLKDALTRFEEMTEQVERYRIISDSSYIRGAQAFNRKATDKHAARLDPDKENV